MTKELGELLEIAGSTTQSPRAGSLQVSMDDLHRAFRLKYNELTQDRLRSIGIGAIVWGLINSGVGFANVGAHPANVILGLIGLFLIIQGVWTLLSPSPGALLVFGISLITVGVWNIITTIVNAQSSKPGLFVLFGVLGIIQVIWGCGAIMRFQRWPDSSGGAPSDTAKAIVEDFDDVVKRSKSEARPDVIEFQSKGFAAFQPWVGRLLSDSAILAQSNGDDLIVARREQIQIEPKGKLPLENRHKVAIRADQKRITAYIPLEHLERLTTWKSQAHPPVSAQAADPVTAKRSPLSTKPAPPSKPTAGSSSNHQTKLLFMCPKCQKRYSVAVEHAGKRSKCVACNSSIRIPASTPLNPN